MKEEKDIVKTGVSSEKIVEDIKNAQKKWDGRPYYKMLKFLFVLFASIIVVLEVFTYVWPKIESKFPESRPIEEKCKEAVCPKICNGECECTYKNKFEVEEQITCMVK